MPPRRRRQQPDPEEFDPLQAIVERIMEHPETQRILDQASAYFDDFGGLIDRAARRAEPVDDTPGGRAGASRARAEARQREAWRRNRHREQQARHQQAAPEPPKETPRQILGFGPTERLTVEIVKKRHRAFASIVHPDRGGSTEIMQRYNVAADELLKELKA